VATNHLHILSAKKTAAMPALRRVGRKIGTNSSFARYVKPMPITVTPKPVESRLRMSTESRDPKAAADTHAMNTRLDARGCGTTEL